MAVVSATLQYLAWPALFKTLAVYGLAARIPVAIIMFPAMRGHWGTHYDSGPPELGFWPRYLLFGLLEELIFWVSFTVATGSLAGSVAAAAGWLAASGLQRCVVLANEPVGCILALPRMPKWKSWPTSWVSSSTSCLEPENPRRHKKRRLRNGYNDGHHHTNQAH